MTYRIAAPFLLVAAALGGCSDRASQFSQQDAQSAAAPDAGADDMDNRVAMACLGELYPLTQRDPAKDEIALQDWFNATNANAYYSMKVESAYAVDGKLPDGDVKTDAARCVTRFLSIS